MLIFQEEKPLFFSIFLFFFSLFLWAAFKKGTNRPYIILIIHQFQHEGKFSILYLIDWGKTDMVLSSQLIFFKNPIFEKTVVFYSRKLYLSAFKCAYYIVILFPALKKKNHKEFKERFLLFKNFIIAIYFILFYFFLTKKVSVFSCLRKLSEAEPYLLCFSKNSISFRCFFFSFFPSNL